MNTSSDDRSQALTDPPLVAKQRRQVRRVFKGDRPPYSERRVRARFVVVHDAVVARLPSAKFAGLEAQIMRDVRTDAF